MTQLEPSSGENHSHLKPFSKCLVKSEKVNQWCLGVVKQCNTESIVQVQYCVQKSSKVERKVAEDMLNSNIPEIQLKMKLNQFILPQHNHLIKHLTANDIGIAESPQVTVCICGNKLDKLTKFVEQSMEKILCTVCGDHDNIKDNMGFYCGNGICDVHGEGFYICMNCIMERMGFVFNDGADFADYDMLMTEDFKSEKSITTTSDIHGDNDDENEDKKQESGIISQLIKNRHDRNGDDHDSDDDDDDDDVRAATGVATKPFAKGSSKIAFLGKLIGSNKACVIKKFMNEHVILPDKFDNEFKCIETAAKLIDEWNKLGKVSKKYVLVKPHLVRAFISNPVQDLIDLLALLQIEEEIKKVNKNENDSKSSEKNSNVDDHDDFKRMLLFNEVMKKRFEKEKENKENQDTVISNELCIIEPYLNGNFTKFNSNSGWQNPQNEKSSVQAFCHWTYHISNEEYLFCDAQGLHKFDKYVLTDPCIVSNKVYATDDTGNIINRQEQTFGVSDVGREFLLNWFKHHKCNKYCDKENWKRPKDIAINNIPDAVVALSESHSSVYNSETTGPGSVSLGSGSIEGKAIRVNYTIDGVDYAKSKHVYHEDKEFIVFIGKVTLVSSGNINNKHAPDQCVLILTDSNRLILISQKTNNAKEFTRHQVKKVTVDSSQPFYFALILKQNHSYVFQVGNGKLSDNRKQRVHGVGGMRMSVTPDFKGNFQKPSNPLSLNLNEEKGRPKNGLEWKKAIHDAFKIKC